MTKFKRSSLNEQNVQIHHTGMRHWVTSATINGKVVQIDSLYIYQLSTKLVEQVTSIYPSNGNHLFIHIQNVDQQTD